MGILDKYAKPYSDSNTEPIGTKVTKEIAEAFRKYCADRGLSVSEGLRWLVIEELEADKRKRERIEPKREPLTTGSYEMDDIIKTKVNQIKPRSSSTGNRFTYDKWAVNGELPCPLCGTWVSQTNISRHMKTQHNGIKAQAVYQQPEHAAKADEMARERKGDTGPNEV